MRRAAAVQVGLNVYRAGALLRRPLESVDRIRGRLDRRQDPSLRVRVASCPTLEEQVHELLGVPVPCDLCQGFDDVWRSVNARLPAPCHHDAGAGLARMLWTVVRHRRPVCAVETGVARGLASSIVLQAMEQNGHGALFSIDLPDLRLARQGWVSLAVPDELRIRWTYLRGASRRLLPSALHDLREIQLFLHDGLHTYRNMMFEFELAWRHLTPGGVMVADDVDSNGAFGHFASWTASPLRLVCAEEARTGAFGLVGKPLSERLDEQKPPEPPWVSRGG